MIDIQRSLEQVRARIAEAALRAGRAPSEITLVAVSKTYPAEAVLEAMAAGQADFGENRVEEAIPKMQAVAGRQMPAVSGQTSEARWHLIGHMQSRKVRDAIGHFELIHSIDTVRLAETINSKTANLHGERHASPQSILLECNISGEASKSGFDVAGWQKDRGILERFAREVEQIAALPHARVSGLMTIAPIVEQPEQARPYFASLRALREALKERFPALALDTLSMGMTGDFEAAIAEGATMLRIGRAIFGERRHD